MRFLFIHQNFPGQFKHLAPALAARGHEVVALGVNKPAWPTPGVRVLLHRPRLAPTPGGEGDADTASLDELRAKMARGASVAAALEKLKAEGFVPDLVCAHSGWGEAFYIKDVFPDVPLLVYAEYFYGTPGGDTHFDPEFSRPSPEAAQRLQTRNLHLMQALVRADRGLAPTRFQRERHPPGLREKIEVIHEGIDTARFAPSPKAVVSLQRAGLKLTPADEVVTFTVRELEPYRGYHVFMRALPELMALRPKAHVVIAGGSGASYGAPAPKGTTWKETFLREVAPRVDRARLHFVGKLPHEVLTQLMQVSTAHVYLTYPFVLSWSLLEAMGCGCLVVGSRTGPVEEVIRHGENGLLVDFFDAGALARTVADAIARRDELRPLREAARAEIVRNYDLQSICLPRLVGLVEGMAKAR